MPKETIKRTHSLSASGQLRAYFIRAKLINRSVKGPAKQLWTEEDWKRSKKGSSQTFQEIILDSEQLLVTTSCKRYVCVSSTSFIFG